MLYCAHCIHRATREASVFVDLGPDGVMLRCDDCIRTYSSHLLPATERVGSRPLYTTGETDTPCTIEGFIAANSDPGGYIDHATGEVCDCAIENAVLDVIRALAVGQAHTEDEGAGGVWTITRVA